MFVRADKIIAFSAAEYLILLLGYFVLLLRVLSPIILLIT